MTTYVLAYGPEVDLLRRCLRSLTAWPGVLRRAHVILADPGDALARYGSGLAQLVAIRRLGSLTLTANPGKYVLMRRAFYETDPPATPFVMWFDADSFVKPGATPADLAALVARDADLVGSAHAYRLTGNQHLWASDQPWAGGAAVRKEQLVPFSVGGWWLARAEALRRIDYPWPTLRHRGGDVMLGLAAQLHGFRRYFLRDDRCPVVIDADALGRPHRGRHAYGIQERPVGFDYLREGDDDGCGVD